MELLYLLRNRTVCCFLGHSWRGWDWKYLSPDSCEQARTCKRCLSRESRAFHHWEKWTADPFVPCYSTVSCSRCSMVVCPELGQLYRLLGPIPIL